MFHGKPGLLLLHPGGVIAFERVTLAPVEFEDPARHVLEEVAIVRYCDNSPGKLAEKLFQPGNRLGIEVVCRFVQQQHVRVLEQQLAERDSPLLTA